MNRTRLCALAALIGGCGIADDHTPPAPTGAQTHALATVQGRGRLRHGGPRPCAAPPHRQFDFWVGRWDVRDSAGDLIGTNIVRDQLDGCLVSESWTDSSGSRGRSLNAYDPSDGRWHQTWVAEALGHLRMAGGLDAQGRMDLRGRRVSAATGFTLLDRYLWTPLQGGRVQQEGTLDIPERDLHFSFLGVYEPSPHVTPVPAPGAANCQAGGSAAASRDLDFAVGRWAISLPGGPPFASSQLRTDLSGCLFEEDLSAPLGYQDKSFLYYDPIERRWNQTLVDNRGHHLMLQGDLSGGRLVLSGGEGALRLRATWEAIAPDQLRQRWEVSLDSGAHWQADLTLLYRRR